MYATPVPAHPPILHFWMNFVFGQREWRITDLSCTPKLVACWTPVPLASPHCRTPLVPATFFLDTDTLQMHEPALIHDATREEHKKKGGGGIKKEDYNYIYD